jgi:alpha-amylase/alpha-mannosidase (GH57 family)
METNLIEHSGCTPGSYFDILINSGAEMSQKELCVAFLWHMHQPDYRNTQTGETYLPWTRFHAVKDYYDMGALAEQAEGMRLTINIVPSLMEQLVSYGAGSTRETYADLTLTDASALSENDKVFLLRAFFQLSPKHMVFPYPRYKELWNRRGTPDERGVYSTGLNAFTIQDYRDLQSWYNLTWCGRELRRNPEIGGFFARGRGYTEEDKKRLLEIQNSFISRILPFYRQLMESRKVEISVSPYYHPILPLLCDSSSARESQPSIPLPSDPYIYPQDAREHIARSIRIYQEFFGCIPRGMWPSEGAISNAALSEAQKAGFKWLASDESVLFNSLQKEGRAAGHLPPERKFCAYRWGNSSEGPCLFFRDHALSDLFGFTYQYWPANEAVEDFLRRLRSIHSSLPDDRKHYIVPIILDGENAWEHYPENGTEFLSLLYQKLSESKDIRAVTFSEFLELENHREPLNSIVAGSWIYGNLATWIGHAEKNKAWEQITAARRRLKASQLANPDQKQTEPAFQEMMIAEGSDWFWWYGDDHQTDNAAEFDELFRSHLKNVYRYLGATPPISLDEPIKKAKTIIQFRNPVHTISPRIDGKNSDYFEWLSAGFAIPMGGESMHRIDRLVEKAFFGFDVNNFYLRLDLAAGKISNFQETSSIAIHFVSPMHCSLSLEFKDNEWSCRTTNWPASDKPPDFTGQTVLELGIPLKILGVRQPENVSLFILALDGGRETERFPTTGFLTIHTDPWSLDKQDWVV